MVGLESWSWRRLERKSSVERVCRGCRGCRDRFVGIGKLRTTVALRAVGVHRHFYSDGPADDIWVDGT